MSEQPLFRMVLLHGKLIGIEIQHTGGSYFSGLLDSPKSERGEWHPVAWDGKTGLLDVAHELLWQLKAEGK